MVILRDPIDGSFFTGRFWDNLWSKDVNEAKEFKDVDEAQTFLYGFSEEHDYHLPSIVTEVVTIITSHKGEEQG